MVVIILLVAGLVLGSFVNALVWRLREQERILEKRKPTKADQKRLAELSIVHGRSMCSHCGHPLAARDLVPVFSWLQLRGKCRYCGARIPDTPFAELFLPLLFLVSYLSWPYALTGWGIAGLVVWAAVLVLFVALALYDLRWLLLPNRMVYPLSIVAMLFVAAMALAGREWVFIWAPVLGSILFFGLFWGLFEVSGGKWLGGGDVKLAAALGLLAGSPLRALLVIFFASLVGTVLGLPQLIGTKRTASHQIPFGPPLMLATIIVVLYGGTIISWYQGLFL